MKKKTRIGNDVRFQPQSFMILTGSNMSGKSTFLRSLGIIWFYLEWVLRLCQPSECASVTRFGFDAIIRFVVR
jgi:ABC-type uncharacterized transport system fused permease/ATPase subunit